MTAQDSVMLKCDACGHEWKSRNTAGKARQCSKCRSRRITVMDPRVIIACGDATEDMKETPLISKASAFSPYKAIFSDDPEVRKKMRELEIAKLDRQIAEERGIELRSDAFNRLVGQHKMLLSILHDGGFLDNEEYEFLSSECPWCGGDDMEPMEVKKGAWGWRCQKCGKEVI